MLARVPKLSAQITPTLRQEFLLRWLRADRVCALRAWLPTKSALYLSCNDLKAASSSISALSPLISRRGSPLYDRALLEAAAAWPTFGSERTRMLDQCPSSSLSGSSCGSIFVVLWISSVAPLRIVLRIYLCDRCCPLRCQQ